MRGVYCLKQDFQDFQDFGDFANERSVVRTGIYEIIGWVDGRKTVRDLGGDRGQRSRLGASLSVSVPCQI